MALNAREKWLLGGLALVGSLLALYTLVHEPLITRRAEARGKLEEVEKELIQEQKRLVREGNLEERRAQVQAREQLIDAWVPGKNSAALLIWHLSQAERLSGARVQSITVGKKELVTVDGKNELKLGSKVPEAVNQNPPASAATPAPDGGAEQGQTDPAHGGQPPSAPGGQAPGALGDDQASAMTTLVMLPLELKVDATFASHLIFNQYLEDAPLFLNTWGVTLTGRADLQLEKVGKLVQSGNPWLAEQALSGSPPVDGLYKIALFFKVNKAGPSTDEMRFDSDAGRIDPFVMAAVDEFIQVLQAYFADQARPVPPLDPSLPSPPVREHPDSGQLG